MSIHKYTITFQYTYSIPAVSTVPTIPAVTYLPTPPPLPPVSPGFESLLHEINKRLIGVETKLTKLDSIEERMSIFDTKFKTVDVEVASCKERIGALEQSAQFLSNVHDEHKVLKSRLEKLTKNIEITISVNNDVKDRLAGIEIQSLRHNLLFFAIDEKSLNTDMETNRNKVDEATGSVTGITENRHLGHQTNKDNENCIDTILDFCENTLEIEHAKTAIKIESAFRLEKFKREAVRPRPIVVTFKNFSDRDMVRKMSKRLKGSGFGISQQFPPEILEKRKKNCYL